MRKLIRNTFATLFMFLVAGLSVDALLAQSRSYRVSDKQVDQLLRRIESRSDNFKSRIDSALDRSSLNGTRSEDYINEYVLKFEEATESLRSRFNERRDVADDVKEVLNRASYINRFLRDNRLGSNVDNQWNSLRSDLNTLARYYNVTWRWDESFYGGPNSTSGRLAGTYRLNVSRSDNVEDVVDRELRDTSSGNRERIRNNVVRRLSSPDMLAFERNGNNVTLASSNSGRVTLQADGRNHSETNNRGRTMTVKAQMSGDNLVVNYTGDRMNDYYISFDPINNNQLRVTRRIYLEDQNRTITVSSTYDKTSDVAQWNEVYPNNQANGSTQGTFVIPNGTRLIATLNNDLATKTTVKGERFSMNVISPSEYNGAVIEGSVTNVERSGRFRGRSQMQLDFDTIRLRDGRTYQFEGLVESVKTLNGDTIRIDNEGAVQENDAQGGRTATRTGIGAAVGAIIGAIAGGGKGAVIGAAIGAGAGVGSVLIQGRDDLELRTGTELTISASSPRNVAVR